MRFVIIASVLLASFSTVARATPQMEPNPSGAKQPVFQVATIKPSKPDEVLSLQIRGRLFAATASSVMDLLEYAYGLHASQIVRGPAWLSSLKYDIIADPETTARPASSQFKLMVQQLVAERFHLAAHRATQQLPVYALTITKGGAKLQPTTRDPNSIPSVAYSPEGRFTAGNAGMSDIVAFLQRFALDRPVVDHTGLAGRYDIALTWSPDELNAAADRSPSNPADALPGFYTTLQEQLGLKLVATKAAVEVLVIDRIEAPTED